MQVKKLRSHQEKANSIGESIATGESDEKFVSAYVTPGGGKTLMASLFAHQLLRAKDVEQVLVVVPRTSLRDQFVSGFHAPDLGLNGELEPNYATTRTLFNRKLVGCVTTYQDIAKSPKRWLKFVRAAKTLVVFDETHHLPDESARDTDAEERGWTKHARPLAEAAVRVLVMTGSRKRGDGAPRAFIRYGEDRVPVEHIQYTRRDAIEERAVIGVEVRLCDGEATYWHRFSEHRHKLSQVGAKEASRSLRALLNDPDYRNRMLDLALEDFARHREVEPSRMIVIAQNRKAAESIHKYLSAKVGKYWPCILALSDRPGSHRAIRRFRDLREGTILVTCQMAHEGLDVPDCTHLVALTNIRSRPWLEQALSRVTRFDPKSSLPWADQRAHIYVPDDPEMAQFVGEWIDEQDPRYDDAPTTREPVGERPVRDSFRFASGTFKDTRFAETFGIFSAIDQRRLKAFRHAFPPMAHKLSLMEQLQVARRIWPDDADVPVTASDEAAE